jgi:hypothetical protein
LKQLGGSWWVNCVVLLSVTSTDSCGGSVQYSMSWCRFLHLHFTLLHRIKIKPYGAKPRRARQGEGEAQRGKEQGGMDFMLMFFEDEKKWRNFRCTQIADPGPFLNRIIRKCNYCTYGRLKVFPLRWNNTPSPIRQRLITSNCVHDL